MAEVIDQQEAGAPAATDLVAEVRRVLAASGEPLTLSKIRAGLPAPYRSLSLEDLAESLRRQVAANVVIPYPKYRSQQERFWDRPMRVHIANLLRNVLEERPLARSELWRKLPAYALGQADAVLQEELAQSRLFRHPRLGSRSKERYGANPPDPKDYLRDELRTLFDRMQQLGFSYPQLRAGALELLHEEEWASPRPAGSPPEATAGEPAQRPENAPAAWSALAGPETNPS